MERRVTEASSSFSGRFKSTSTRATTASAKLRYVESLCVSKFHVRLCHLGLIRARATLSPLDAWTPTHNLEFAQQLMMSIKDKTPNYEKFLNKYSLFLADMESEESEVIEKIEVAIDTRPRAPTLVRARWLVMLCAPCL